ncbi:MAG: BBP7 family outer membrane beta-barrel protein [Aureliella sp.]
MFERLWCSGSRVGGRKLVRAALLAGLTVGAWTAQAGSVSAQLRSGGVERPLYRQSAPVASPTASRAVRPATRSQSRLAPASADGTRIVRAPAPRSIMEQSDASAPRQATPSKSETQSRVQPMPDPLPNDDAITTFDDGSSGGFDGGVYDSYDAGGYGGYESYAGNFGGGGGCSCGQCGGQGDYFSDLAPGCCQASCGAGMCDGPLSRLLGRLSVRAEAGLFWRRGMGLPPLVTTAPVGTAANVAGQLGQNSTQVLLGNNIVNQDMQAGFRINVATWLDPSCYRGVIVRYTNAGDQSNDFVFTSSATPILARPFNNITSGTSTPDTQLVSYPGDSSGDIRVRTTSELDGFDIALKRLAYRDRFTRADWLFGYQHNHIAESLHITSNTTVTGNVPPLTGSSISVSDMVRTTNNFNGAVIGLMSTRQFAYFKFEAIGRLGLGSLERRVDLAGSTTTTSSAGVATTESQGLLVRNTNNRPFKDDTFVTVPEFGLNAGYYLTPNIDFSFGYNYVLIPKVAQPGRQLDGTINLSDPLSGAMRPQLALSTQPYWIHSLNLGMQWRY